MQQAQTLGRRRGAFDDLLAKLDGIAGPGSELGEAGRAVVLDWSYHLSNVRQGHILPDEGRGVAGCRLLVTGMVARCRFTSAGAQQILSLHFPGDLLDLGRCFGIGDDHPFQALGGAVIATVPMRSVREATLGSPGLASALWGDAMLELAIARDWLINIGHRDARSRTAHLLCELGVRTAACGTGAAIRFDLPLTQTQLGMALALTPVHTNRTLRLLRNEALIRYGAGRVEVIDHPGLCTAGRFDPTYLRPFQRMQAARGG